MATTEAEFRRLAQAHYAHALEQACRGTNDEDAQDLALWRAVREALFQQHLESHPSLDFWAWLFDLAPCEGVMRKAS